LKGELKRVDRVDTIMTEGIHGYLVRIRNGSTGATLEHHVHTEQLSAFLSREQEAGNLISIVEPQRTNLEEFFLQIVKGA